MRKPILGIAFIAIVSAGFFLNSCKKTETTNISKPPVLVASGISDTTSGGAVSGTMVSGTTYNISRDLTVPAGDTLWLQSGVKVCISNAAAIVVKGALISLGTSTAPNWFTVCNATKVNTIAQSENPSTDPAWNGGQGWWPGISCDTSCTLLVIKWTHIEFTGKPFPVAENFVGGAQGGTAYGILFQNPIGDFIMEDSWMYGTIDDAIRVQTGRLSVMRNTFEKTSYTTGDCVNVKSGSVGDMAYNLFVGTATNGTKASNKGANTPECNINMYNNTYIDGGYRQAEAGRGADIDYEQAAEGMAYNNLIVNCKFGLRIVGSPIADTTHCYYSNNYAYGDSLSVVDQFYPVGYITKIGAYILPATTNCNYDPAGDSSYVDTMNVGLNNPLFVNFPLPEQNIIHLYDINWASGFDFHLQSSSPAIGKGYTGFSPVHAVQVSTALSYGPVITPPGVDIGCYQSNGSGNQH